MFKFIIEDDRTVYKITMNINVTSITVIATAVVGGSGAAVGVRPVHIVATTSAGKAVRIEVGKVMAGASSSASSSASSKAVGRATTAVQPLFYYHSSPLVALAVEGSSSSIGSLLITGGDDRRICVWDTLERCLVTRVTTQVSPS